MRWNVSGYPCLSLPFVLAQMPLKTRKRLLARPLLAVHLPAADVYTIGCCGPLCARENTGATGLAVL